MTMTNGSIPPISGKKDRGAVVVKGKEKKKADIGLFLLIAVAILVPVGFLLWFFTSGSTPKKAPTPKQVTDEVILTKDVSNTNSLTSLMGEVVYKQKQREEEKKVEELPPPQVETKPLPQPKLPDGTTPKLSEPQSTEVDTSALRRLSAGLSPELGSTSPKPPVNPALANAGMDTKLNGPKYAKGSAQIVKNRNFLLNHGTNIPCGLQTEIISTHPGITTCIVTSDVYSSNGATLLVEKGSKVFGNQSVAIQQGQARAFVTWSDIQTTEGVSISIDSLGTGPRGASGVDVWVDNHFKERFGGAIMLSFLDDAFSTLSARLSNTDVEVDESVNNASEMASTALDNSINIAPTGYASIGARLNILVARDVDMSNVYSLED